MGLTKTQAAIWQKARSLGNGAQGVGLSEESCAYLVGRIVQDLQLGRQFPEFAPELAPFFTDEPLDQLIVQGLDSKALFERLVSSQPDADMYFACLATMHKARLKYERILSTQPLPTLEQVGPRGLLQFGKVNTGALAGFLFWRKWFYDLDNRAAQETGYLFEPIIAHAIGGTPAPARKSPVKRRTDQSKGRQVDCIRDDRAYEFKIRVTIAASGQGRWQEELDFPADCRTSGFTPVLICLDSTPNPKLDALMAAFRQVMNYFRQNKQELKRIVETEDDVSVEKDGYILTGKIDLLMGSDGRLELLDFKTSPRPVDSQELLRMYEQQLCTYAHILERRHAKRFERLVLYWTAEEKKANAIKEFPYRPGV